MFLCNIKSKLITNIFYQKSQQENKSGKQVVLKSGLLTEVALEQSERKSEFKSNNLAKSVISLLSSSPRLGTKK